MNQLCPLNVIVLIVTKHMTISNRNLSKRCLHILHVNINSQLHNIVKIRFIAKQSNTSSMGIGESKLESYMLKSVLDIEEFNLIRMEHLETKGKQSSML